MDQENDIQSCRKLLNEIAEMCEHASLTGSLSSGSKRTAQRFNTVLDRLTRQGSVPQGLFSPVPEDADYGEIGVEARMLAAYFQEDRKNKKNHDDGDRNVLIRLAPFVRQEELGMLIREHKIKGIGVDMHTLTSLAPFLGQDILSELIREHLEKPAAPASETPVAPQPPSQPVAPTVAEAPAKPNYTLAATPPEKENVSELLDMLKSSYLSEEERLALLERVRAATT